MKFSQKENSKILSNATLNSKCHILEANIFTGNFTILNITDNFATYGIKGNSDICLNLATQNIVILEALLLPQEQGFCKHFI